MCGYPLHIHIGLITKTKVKRIIAALNGLLKLFGLKSTCNKGFKIWRDSKVWQIIFKFKTNLFEEFGLQFGLGRSTCGFLSLWLHAFVFCVGHIFIKYFIVHLKLENIFNNLFGLNNIFK